MTARTVKTWSFVHKWTSLVCTALLLMLCITGLPLIFYHEIDHLTGNAFEPPAMPAETSNASIDRIVEASKARRPGEVVQFVLWDRDEPELVHVTMALTPDTPPEKTHAVVIDGRTAAVLGEPKTQEGVMHVLYKLHVDLFAGLPGKLFLGVIGLLFAASIVSGVVLYAPFMRRLDFGTVRTGRSPRTRWLDMHNLLGIVVLVWTLVVGVTGVINTWADLVLGGWRSGQLAEMVAPYQDKPQPARLASVQAAVDVARKAAPDMVPSFVAFPGTQFSSRHHYAVFMRGDAPLTARLLKPALVDAETGELTDIRAMPWYVTTLLVSQPLHFGDYGGIPLKIIWAILDVVTIIVLLTGLYLWLRRGRVPAGADGRIEAAEAGSVMTPAVLHPVDRGP
ncbi:MAG: PepSY domain-containing protein [Rhizobiales bacterium]|nr:PepSY domain-containing protein [Hyphomicrobiales bacterium]